jgi:ubiquinone/menaquinone biosynthesis C-methylase UbiE
MTAPKSAAAQQHASSIWREAATVSNYLDTSRQAIPLAAEQIDAMFRVIAAFGGPTRTVLDVGAGDGAAAAAVAERFPVERITLVDYSLPMLQRAVQRFQGGPHLVDVIEADLANTAWLDELPGDVPEYDLVVSRYAVHHLTDRRKRDLYAELYERMNPGGLFFNIEHVSSVSPVYSATFDDLIIEGMVATSGTGQTLAEATAAYHGRYDAESNILVPADAQCDWLRDTGFVDVDVVMKVFELAVIVARRPDSTR